MHKLLRTTHGHLLTTLKNQPGNLKFFTPTSHLPNATKMQVPNSKLGFILNEFEELQSSNPLEPRIQVDTRTEKPSERSGLSSFAAKESAVQISHPWPEWVELMELLLKRGYFEWGENPFQNNELDAKDSNAIRTACLNFARDRFDLIRFFSREDIRVVAESGCPSIDRKVVNSGKRLRGFAGVDEGNVCSSCILRGNCERAYVKAREDESGRTVDVMRILLTYGLDYITGSVENQPRQGKRIKESVRRLLKEMVELSTKQPADLQITNPSERLSSLPENSTPQEKGQINVPMRQGDWHCPKCNFLNFARNIKCLRCDGLFQERLRKLGEDRDHLPLKKGDWICDKCNFLNFAKNTRCLQCREKPPKRQINPGEWECDSCNYINFRRNMVCLKCDHRRPKASSYSDTSARLRHHNGGFSQPHGMKFVKGEANGQPSDGQEGHGQNKGGNMWRFVENESEDHDGSSQSHEMLGFVDFPIAGGKSELSQNAEKRDRWKVEIADRIRHSSKVIENTDEFRSANFQRRFEFLESTDDEEMAEWFGHGKKQLATES